MATFHNIPKNREPRSQGNIATLAKMSIFKGNSISKFAQNVTMRGFFHFGQFCPFWGSIMGSFWVPFWGSGWPRESLGEPRASLVPLWEPAWAVRDSPDPKNWGHFPPVRAWREMGSKMGHFLGQKWPQKRPHFGPPKMAKNCPKMAKNPDFSLFGPKNDEILILIFPL